jgi:hypothetical protein
MQLSWSAQEALQGSKKGDPPPTSGEVLLELTLMPSHATPVAPTMATSAAASVRLHLLDLMFASSWACPGHASKVYVLSAQFAQRRRILGAD